MRTTLTGLLVAALLLTGCGSDTPETPDAPAVPTPADGVVLELGDTGGTFELRDGTTLIVPEDAFDDGDTLIVDYDVNADLPDGYTSLGAPFDVHATSGDQPHVPVDLVVPYDPDSAPDGIPLEDLFGVSTLNEDTDLWDPLDVTFDTTANTMTAAVTSFSLKWPWEWDWAGMAAEVSDDLGKLVGVRAGGIECTRGTEPPDWFNTTSFSNNAGDAIRACVEADTKNQDVLVIELQNNRSGGQWITWDIPRVGTQGAQQADHAIAWTWSELGEARDRVNSWLSKQIGTKGLYLPPLGRATIAMREDDWYLATFEVPDPGDVKPTIVIDALLTTIDLALGKAISSGTGLTARKLKLRDAALTWALVECKDLISPWNAVSTPSGADLLHAAGDCLVGLEKSAVYSSLMNVEELAKFSGATKAISSAVTIGTYVGKAGVYVADMTLFNKWEPTEYTVLARSNQTFPDTPDLTKLILSPEGLGPLKYGATIEQAEASGLVTWDPVACPKEIYGADYGSFAVDNTRYPLGDNPVDLNENFGAFGVSLDSDTETVNWIEVYNPAIATSDGLHVGDTVTKLRDTYGEDNLQFDPDNRISAQSYVLWVNRGPVDVEFEIFSGPEGVDRDSPSKIWRIAVIQTGFPKGPHWATGNAPGSCSG